MGAPSRSGRWARRSAQVPLALLLATAWGCATGARDSAPALPASLRPYLLSPVLVVPSAGTPAATLEEGFRRLLAGDATAAREAARSVLAADPERLSALVLAAQADLVDGRYGEARRRLEARVTAADDEPAARLALARAADLDGDALAAYRAYRGMSARFPVAADRARALESEALAGASRAVGAAIEAGRIDDAVAELGELETWAPGSVPALQAGWRVAGALDDPQRELALLRELRGLEPLGPEVEGRWAELEVERGDAQTGLRVLERLADERPLDAGRAERLARARFQWRLLLLPEEILATTREAELDRAEYASLLYWLLPGLRGASSGGRIATDILDIDPQRRQEVARVVNRGVMDVEPVERRFEPRRPLRREEALEALLRVLESSSPRPHCVDGLARNRSPSAEAICMAAVDCALLSASEACLPSARVAGADAQELIRRALAALPEN